MQILKHLVETLGFLPWVLDRVDEVLMIGGDCCDLVLDDSVHLTDSKVDSASEHVLVVDGKPLSQDLDNFR